MRQMRGTSNNNRGRARKPEHTWRTLGRLLQYTFASSRTMWVVSIISIIVAALSASLGSKFIQTLIDSYIMPLTKEATPNFAPLIQAIAIMAAIYYTGVIGTGIFTQLQVIIGQRVQKQIRDEMFEHMQSLPMSYFDRNDVGDIMSRYTNDVDTLMQMISQSIPTFIQSLFNMVFVLIMMILISPLLTLLSLVVLGLSIIFVRVLFSQSSRYFSAQQRALGTVNGYAEEILNGLKVVKVFSHEQAVQKQFDTYNSGLRNDSAKANAYATMVFPIMGNMSNLLYVLTAVVGGTLAVNNVITLTLGGLAAFLQLSRGFTQPVAQISQQVNSIIMALAGAERIFGLLDEKPESDDGKVTLTNMKKDAAGNLVPTKEHTENWAWQVPGTPVKLVPVQGVVEFKDVNFSYYPGVQILHDINLTAKAGEKVAFVGATGAGKTTITSMINRFYDIDSGQITYDGIDIREIKKADLRRSLAIVLQETNLFTDTIMNNIRMGNLDATDDEVIAAAKLANADEFIQELPKGYQSTIDGDGSDLSQGQRQLLSIARAAVADPPVMIMDEATASIDTRTERAVQAGMDNLMKGRTTFVIAHRLSTIFNSDLIIVLDHGKIVERGNHEQLMAQHGEYYQLYTGSLVLE
ncbi:ABC transporter [Schleiferilactobacillus harbinensis]|jgi:ATP-binding cassette subfamily B protein|nr:ABC transporter [Schleiferilactobacillus harbinensis]